MMAAATARTKPRGELLRGELIRMLLRDREQALQLRNPSAAITASTKIADLMLRQLTEEEAATKPVTRLTHRIVHLCLCPACREKQPVTDTPPPPEPEVSRLQRGASGWDDPDPKTEPDPASPASARQSEKVVLVPKTPEQMNRRRRRDPVVSGLV